MLVVILSLYYLTWKIKRPSRLTELENAGDGAQRRSIEMEHESDGAPREIERNESCKRGYVMFRKNNKIFNVGKVIIFNVGGVMPK